MGLMYKTAEKRLHVNLSAENENNYHERRLENLAQHAECIADVRLNGAGRDAQYFAHLLRVHPAEIAELEHFAVFGRQLLGRNAQFGRQLLVAGVVKLGYEVVAEQVALFRSVTLLHFVVLVFVHTDIVRAADEVGVERLDGRSLAPFFPQAHEAALRHFFGLVFVAQYRQRIAEQIAVVLPEYMFKRPVRSFLQQLFEFVFCFQSLCGLCCGCKCSFFADAMI